MTPSNRERRHVVSVSGTGGKTGGRTRGEKVGSPRLRGLFSWGRGLFVRRLIVGRRVVGS